MTKKEIIRNLKYTMEKHKNDRVDTFGTNISLMCKDILDYLEKEPCGKDINVPATDCISRQMAIDALGECPINWTDSDGEITAESDWKDTVEMLKSLPSITPQSKTGHWILAANQSKEDVLNDNYRFICSECKCSDIHAKSTKVPYCWKCGSKMEVEE